MLINDQSTRRQALNPEQSFIVQAPAGSGKTELLTQRFLSLLAHACQAPEEIIAITFTRKAAAEMRERILQSLKLAQDPNPPQVLHKKTAWELGREVLKKNHTLRWRLLENPQRLRILTIDALCKQFISHLPLLAGYGAAIGIVKDPQAVYQQAVHEWLLNSPPIELLTHLDNNPKKLMTLLIDLLAKREQWLPYILLDNPKQLRQKIETGLALLAEEILQTLQPKISSVLSNRLLPLLNFAGKNLQVKNPSHPLTQWAHQLNFPQLVAQELSLWQSLAQTCLTGEGEWRKKIDISLGFPPKSAEKQDFIDILNLWREDLALKQNLERLIACPPIHYSESQWQIIHTIIEILPGLVAELQIIFKQQGMMDFVEMALSASTALGQEQEPTNLALALDYQIRHLLIDEFQDTSVTQFKLIEKLLWGWERGDGRSIFLVGDPMQSIYRFRNAEVGLFLRTAQQGIQHIQLTPLTLNLNFRSDAQLINWFNQNFPNILPPLADADSGAIPYTPVMNPAETSGNARVSCYACNDLNDQGQQVLEIVQQLHQQNPQAKIAILVRSRLHLPAIISTFQTAGLPFQAVDIESLATRSEIQDLLALTRGLLHRADKIAWLAILRSPYCGLTLNDCHLIAQQAHHQTLYSILLNYKQLTHLSEDGYQRLHRVVPILSQALSNRGRQSLAEWIEETWLALGGPASVNFTYELLNTQAYFKLLITLTATNPILNLAVLNQKLQKLYAAPQTSKEAYLQIMTIHKAKGLEFDHVILPELQRKPVADDSRLLLWSERAATSGGSHLILAPIKEASANHDPMYVYLKNIDQQKLIHESKRLLYVAVTRAKQTLHLLAVLPEKNENYKPPADSFLQMLWPCFSAECHYSSSEIQLIDSTANNFTLQRLTASWQLPDALFQPSKTLNLESFSNHRALSYDPKSAWVGTVIHEGLAYLAESAPNFPDPESNPLWEKRLLQLGLPQTGLDTALSTVHTALKNILLDPRGLWILSPDHTHQKNEYALSAKLQDQIIHIIIDRTFVDSEGTRWIIDYKTGDESDLSHYYDQLNLYAKVMSLHDSRPIKSGIYFPLSKTWHSIDTERPIYE